MAKYKDAPSIMQDEKVCFLSGTLEGLERHHIYGGANRRTAQNTACGYGFGMTYTMSRLTAYTSTRRTTAFCSG